MIENDDQRWLHVQRELRDILTTQRTNQQELTRLEMALGKLDDHVEDVDDHLRGVAGESLDTRVVILERESKAHENEARAYGHRMLDMEKQLNAVQSTVNTYMMKSAIVKEADATKNERVREWLKFWGPIILASLALVVPLARELFANWDKVTAVFHQEPLTVQSMQAQINREKAGQRGKAVRKRVRELEREGQGQ